MNFLIGIGFGLVAGVIAWVIMRIATIKIRKELKANARLELEDIRFQEGYNAVYFMRGNRQRATSKEDAEERELMSTTTGKELSSFNRLMLKFSIAVFVLVTIAIIVGRYLKGI